MKKSLYLTQDGVIQLQAKLNELHQQRQTAIAAMQIARESGNLEENTEYISAKQNLEKLEVRINEIASIIANAQLIDPKKTSKNSHIMLGSIVTLSLNNATQKQLQVVNTVEVDPLNNKISDESPLGRDLLGKKSGDQVKVGKMSYKIVSVK